VGGFFRLDDLAHACGRTASNRTRGRFSFHSRLFENLVRNKKPPAFSHGGYRSIPKSIGTQNPLRRTKQNIQTPINEAASRFQRAEQRGPLQFDITFSAGEK
jgi:hypothetical protein